VISNKPDWACALTFLETELCAFETLYRALKSQAAALRLFNIANLENCQLGLESALAHTENVVYERVKWQQEYVGRSIAPTWQAMMDIAPHSVKSAHEDNVNRLRTLGQQVREALAQNQRYSWAAKEMLGSLKHVEHKIISEKTDLYTARGTLSGHVAMGATNGGAR
jgi:hypothetical protein